MEETKKCPKCAGGIEKGYSYRDIWWVKGERRLNPFFGILLAPFTR